MGTNDCQAHHWIGTSLIGKLNKPNGGTDPGPAIRPSGRGDGYMIYASAGRTGLRISALALGGHEYLADGRSRGFNEDFALSVKPGHVFDGFGGENRKSLLATAYEHGINFFDVTQDSEKAALGRNLTEAAPRHQVYVQTRPEGMVYNYDLHNAKMADYDLLKGEVVRILGLLRRKQVDFLNLGFMKAALDHDPEYLRKIGHNIEGLKAEGLIRFACADTFSGEHTYLQQISAGCFDAIFVNFNVADDGPARQVLRAAHQKGMAVFVREAFMKGHLFRMGEEVGVLDHSRLAQAALRWCLQFPEITTVVVGAANVEQLLSSLSVLDRPQLDSEDQALIGHVEQSPTFQAYAEKKHREFFCCAGQ
jgi:predicted aldo/keto reductase-like oxidoreductase